MHGLPRSHLILRCRQGAHESTARFLRRDAGGSWRFTLIMLRFERRSSLEVSMKNHLRSNTEYGLREPERERGRERRDFLFQARIISGRTSHLPDSAVLAGPIKQLDKNPSTLVDCFATAFFRSMQQWHDSTWKTGLARTTPAGNSRKFAHICNSRRARISNGIQFA